MKPVNFPEANQVFHKPPGMTDDQCVDLPVHNDGTQLLSCWEMSDEEKLQAVFFGRIWLSVAGARQPPIWIAVGKTVFVTSETPDGQFLERYKQRIIGKFLQKRIMQISNPEEMERLLLEFLDSLFSKDK